MYQLSKVLKITDTAQNEHVGMSQSPRVYLDKDIKSILFSVKE